jgi:ABC-type transport system involved in multi-copper enzyme maturation permease subunit
MAERFQELSPLHSAARATTSWPLGEDSPRGVAATVFRNEVRRTIGGFRFKACAFLLLYVMALAAITAGARYRSETLERSAVLEDFSAQVADATVDQIVATLHPAIKPPWRLSLVVNGGQTATPAVYHQALSALVAPEIRTIDRGNHRLPAREPFDWMFAIRVVLSLAAFLLGYDAVCGERRAGTLKLVLSYPVPRWKVFAGKLMALWSCLAVPFLAGAVLSLLLALGPGRISLSSGDLTKAGLVALLGLWAAAVFALTTLLVSSLVRAPSTSLSVLAWLWVTGVIVVPAVSGVLAHLMRPIPTGNEIGREMAAIQQRIAVESAGREGHWRPPEWAAADDFAWERISAAIERRRFGLQEEVRRGVLRRKIAQARLARTLASISPASLTTDLAERLTGSGLWRDDSFLEQAWAFRPALAAQVKALDAGDPESPHILFFSGYVSKRPVSAGALGRFVFCERSVLQGLAAARPALLLFALETIALAIAALFFFSRYDVG